MLLVPFDSLPKGLVEAIPLARGSARIQGGKGGGGGGGGERIGLYWEIYGMKLSGEALSFSLTIIKNKKNWRRKLSESNLDRDERPMSLNWEEEVEPRIAGAPRALSIELPQMKKGSYILALIIDGFGREPVIASRVLTVER